MFNKYRFYYQGSVRTRAGLTQQWAATDNELQYRRVTPKGLNLYSSEDYLYKFNKHGFRCDNFDVHSDIPMLFTGCSITEGIGLPLKDLWAYQLAKKIEQETGKTVPFWNLSLSGAGLDTISSLLYWHQKEINVPIKYIVGLFPSFLRREFCYENDKVLSWVARNLFREYNVANVDRLFSDEYFQEHQSHRSLMLIDSIAKNLGAEVVYSLWHYPGNPPCYREIDYYKKYFPHFKYVSYPDPEVYAIDCARDGLHPGPTIHKEIVQHYWNQYFSKI